MRHGMWEKVASRSHKPAKIYSFGPGSDEVMLYGTVDYELKDGKKTSDIEWAARAQFTSADGQLKMSFYQVYLVCISPAECEFDARALLTTAQDTAAMAAKAK